MSHFTLPDGTRLWAKEVTDEKIAIHSGNEVELVQTGLIDDSRKMPKLHLDKEGVVELRLIDRPNSDEPRTIARQRFVLKAVGEGVARLSDKDGLGGSAPLKVVAGKFKNHKGMVKDLLAEVGRSSNPLLLYKLQRLLHNDYENIFNQFNDASLAKHHSPLYCGRVAKAGGETLIGRVVSHSYGKDSSYHKPLRKVTSRDDVDPRCDAQSEADHRRACDEWAPGPGRLRL
jgi:hypothetical protein